LLVLAIGKWVSARRRARAVPVPGVAAARAPVGLRRLLLAADGSESCRRATAHVIELRRDLREPDGVELHVVNVQRPLPRDVSTFIAGKTIDEYYQERSEEALSPVRARLDEAGFAHQVHRRVGDPVHQHHQADELVSDRLSARLRLDGLHHVRDQDGGR
ncbi:MAG TPA: universal stress protein, partial [Burkholderiaceae bacterium]|nr:universal stress protein [Burkholderiaceae bacterium]